MSIWTSFDNCRRDWATEREEREREEGRSAAFWFLWWQLLCCMLHVARSQLAGVCVLLLLHVAVNNY